MSRLSPYFAARVAVTLVAVTLLGSGCTVISVAAGAVSVAGSVVSTGVSVGSAAVGATVDVAKGAVNVGSAIVGAKSD